MPSDARTPAPGAVTLSAFDARAGDVLAYWIGPAADDVAALERRQQLWFTPDAGTDATIRERFGALVDAAGAGALDAWARHPGDWLALLIVLDQFPRNLWRGDARAFAFDARALAHAREGIARGFDLALPANARLFCYLPLEHAEDLGAQQQSVALFEALLAEAPPGAGTVYEVWLDYARRHAEVIARFGRFPHRNAALGRENTAAEAAYLARPGAGF